MKNFTIYILIILVCFGCADTNKKKPTGTEGARDPNNEPTESKQYQNTQWQLQASVPPQYGILESKLPGDVPIINFYSKTTKKNPPFVYHEAPNLSYIAVLPKGFGTETPNGKQQPLSKWDGRLATGFDLNKEKSTVFLLENGEPWAYMLTPASLPNDWNEYGTIFVHVSVTDFEGKCSTKNNTEKPMEECEVLGGTDRIAFYGTVDAASKNELHDILKSLQFISTEDVETPISDLIKVEKPLPNIEVSSPLTVKGRARGYWFFEGTAGLRLEDKDGKTLAESHVKTKNGWMTEDFVPFSGTLTFDAPNDARGYLVFERANPSGKPENEREYRLPVIFPPR
ncbi:Gmad2 immunoglobulin-like domain-containing protein [Marixanthomonas spongiae]|uniref:Bacterial spore germination immunoglobulin-like domain-containing protein n=1 Tax=Marixanthomonas spongiae TaxID=2174845 RepID=A0A2U0I5F5_9FLAO|nr:Gmad2 immunoglobulin-like domain-containing protein [Marixanthomonas spongiae]PVW16240.1 hypothetical protein DDV96_02935 [Marixanthomonas spongiae]